MSWICSNISTTWRLSLATCCLCVSIRWIGITPPYKPIIFSSPGSILYRPSGLVLPNFDGFPNFNFPRPPLPRRWEKSSQYAIQCFRFNYRNECSLASHDQRQLTLENCLLAPLWRRPKYSYKRARTQNEWTNIEDEKGQNIFCNLKMWNKTRCAIACESLWLLRPCSFTLAILPIYSALRRRMRGKSLKCLILFRTLIYAPLTHWHWNTAKKIWCLWKKSNSANMLKIRIILKLNATPTLVRSALRIIAGLHWLKGKLFGDKSLLRICQHQ